MYHAADKHDTPVSHFKLKLGRPSLFYALNVEHKPGKQQFSIFSL